MKHVGFSRRCKNSALLCKVRWWEWHAESWLEHSEAQTSGWQDWICISGEPLLNTHGRPSGGVSLCVCVCFHCGLILMFVLIPQTFSLFICTQTETSLCWFFFRRPCQHCLSLQKAAFRGAFFFLLNWFIFETKLLRSHLTLLFLLLFFWMHVGSLDLALDLVGLLKTTRPIEPSVHTSCSV